MMPRSATATVTFVMLCSLSACGAAATPSPGASTTAGGASVTTPVTMPVTTETVTPYSPPPKPAAPAERSALPSGVYRVQLPFSVLTAHGIDDRGMSGTWTLTVRDGTFKLECVPVETPGAECGTKDPSSPPVVEVGTLHGTGQTVWFVHDQEQLVRLSGCVRHSQKLNGCGPEDDYHLDWSRVGDQLSFKNFVGIGDQAGFPELSNWTVLPWKRIG